MWLAFLFCLLSYIKSEEGQMLPTCQSPGVQKPGWASLSFGQGRLFILFSGQWVEWFLTGQRDKKKGNWISSSKQDAILDLPPTRLRGQGRRGGRKNVRITGWRPVQGSAALWTQHNYCMNTLTALCACVQHVYSINQTALPEWTVRWPPGPTPYWGAVGSR